MALAAFLLHKLLVLSASLPAPRGPPASRLLRRFFTPDSWYVARHMAELFAAVVLLGIRCAQGELPVGYFLPVAAAGLSPLVRLLSFYPASASLREAALFIALLFGAPFLLLLELGKLGWRHHRRLLNPLDGPVHVLISLAAVVLCLSCQSRRPVAILFVAHSLLLAAGLCERVTWRRLRWRAGHAWWCALLIATEAFNLAIGRRWATLLLLLVALRSLQRVVARPLPQALFQGPLWWCMLLVVAEAISVSLREVRGMPPRAAPATLAASIWLGLVGGLTCAVNWGSCVREYHGWQQRHAVFVLCASSASPQDGFSTQRQEDALAESV